MRMIAEPLATEAASSEPKSPEALLIENEELKQKVLMLEDTIERTEGLCEPLMGGGWAESLQSRATWLIGLLIAQSASSFILADNENLLATHPTVIFFLTMLVGAGGNAGNQASVRLIRGLATGEVNGSREQTLEIFANEARVALALGGIRECTPCALRPERSRPRSRPPSPTPPPPPLPCACSLPPERPDAHHGSGHRGLCARRGLRHCLGRRARDLGLALLDRHHLRHARHGDKARTHAAQRDAPLLITPPPRPAAYHPPAPRIHGAQHAQRTPPAATRSHTRALLHLGARLHLLGRTISRVVHHLSYHASCQALPLGLSKLRVDAAHASTSIQVSRHVTRP